MKELSKENIYICKSLKSKMMFMFIQLQIYIGIGFIGTLLSISALTDANVIACAIFSSTTIICFVLLYLTIKKILYAEEAIYCSEIFENETKPFIDIGTIYSQSIYGFRPQKSFVIFERKKTMQNTFKYVSGAIKKGYLINCTIEINNGIPQVALAKKVVKDSCPYCGAPIINAINNNYRCSYCGKKITNVIERK